MACYNRDSIPTKLDSGCILTVSPRDGCWDGTFPREDRRKCVEHLLLLQHRGERYCRVPYVFCSKEGALLSSSNTCSFVKGALIVSHQTVNILVKRKVVQTGLDVDELMMMNKVIQFNNRVITEAKLTNNRRDYAATSHIFII